MMTTSDYDQYRDYHVPRTVLVEMLSQSIGVEKAEEEMRMLALKMGYTDAILTGEQALLLLDSLAEQGGMIAVVARLAKNRIFLRQT